jgi:hypothetical protein
MRIHHRTSKPNSISIEIAVSSLELYRKRSSLSLSKTYQQKSRIGRTCSERSESGKIGIENSIH